MPITAQRSIQQLYPSISSLIPSSSSPPQSGLGLLIFLNYLDLFYYVKLLSLRALKISAIHLCSFCLVYPKGAALPALIHAGSSCPEQNPASDSNLSIILAEFDLSVCADRTCIYWLKCAASWCVCETVHISLYNIHCWAFFQKSGFDQSCDWIGM